MNVMIFITDNGTPEGTGPVLFLADKEGAVLPANPRSYPWRYFATVTEDDRIIDAEARQALNASDSFISQRILGRLSPAWAG